MDAVARFLIPFDCWSMVDYGLYGEQEGQSKLSRIDDQSKAAAFLRLLDLTIGKAETSVIHTTWLMRLSRFEELLRSSRTTRRFVAWPPQHAADSTHLRL